MSFAHSIVTFYNATLKQTEKMKTKKKETHTGKKTVLKMCRTSKRIYYIHDIIK